MESRCRLLNNFLRRLSKIPYLWNGEEIKLFISNTKDLPKAFEKMPKRPYEEMYSVYKKLYPKYYASYDLVMGKGKIETFQNFSKKLRQSISVKIFL
ncbi:MAG: hypothetical protein MJ252_20565 [archaeon]|nr:hypothetical protein [archaeon]